MWSNAKEIISTLQVEEENYKKAYSAQYAGGPLLYKENGRSWRSTSDHNILVVGEPGCGKTSGPVSSMLSSCIRNSESLIIYDVKSDFEGYLEVAKRKNYNIVNLSLRDPDGDSYNVLDLVYKLLKSDDPLSLKRAQENIHNIAEILVPDDVDKDSTFWPSSARSLLEGMIYALFSCADCQEQFHLDNVARLIENCDADHPFSHPIRKLYQEAAEDPDLKNRAEILRSLAVIASSTAKETNSNIIQFALNGLAPITANEVTRRMFCTSSFCLEELINDRRHPFCILVTGQDETSAYKRGLGMLLSYFCKVIINTRQIDYEPNRRINFIFDEAASLPTIPDFDLFLSTARSRNVRVMLTYQNLHQISLHFGTEKSQVILGMFQTQICFRTADSESNKMISEKAGQTVFLDSKTGVRAERPQISISDLSKLPDRKAVIFHGKLIYCFDYPFYSKPAVHKPVDKNSSRRSTLIEFGWKEILKLIFIKKMARVEESIRDGDVDDT